MDWLSTLSNMTVGGRSIWQLIAPFASLLIGLMAGRAVQFVLLRTVALLKKRERHIASATLRAVAGVATFIGFIVGLKVGLLFLDMGESASSLIGTTISVLIALAIGYVAYCLIDVVDQWLIRITHHESLRVSKMVRPIVRATLRVTVILLVLLQVAEMLTDKPLTSVLAGLGVGGLAVALAAQDTVKNFFGSLVIFADKPFELGERVAVDGFDGAVESIGLRSTRIRTLDGHLITVPNGELANKTIQNIGRRPFLRRVANIMLDRATSAEKVRRAVEIIKEELNEHEGMKEPLPPRVVFNELPSTAATAVNILVIYWYHPPDYWLFMAFNERFNLKLLERFSAEGISFAAPAQTVRVMNAETAS